MTGLSRLRAQLAAASEGPWFVVGPPWNHGAPFVNARTEDPHGGEIVCDFVDYRGDAGPDELPYSEENAALIVSLRNCAAELLAVAEFASRVAQPVTMTASGSDMQQLKLALSALESRLAAAQETET